MYTCMHEFTLVTIQFHLDETALPQVADVYTCAHAASESPSSEKLRRFEYFRAYAHICIWSLLMSFEGGIGLAMLIFWEEKNKHDGGATKLSMLCLSSIFFGPTSQTTRCL